MDSWNVTGYYENAFYTEPFKEVLLKNNYTQIEYTTPEIFTHTFKIKAPLLTQGQVPFIAEAALMLWEFGMQIVICCCTEQKVEDFWSIDVDLTGADFPIEYKYGVYDVRESRRYSLRVERTVAFTILLHLTKKQL